MESFYLEFLPCIVIMSILVELSVVIITEVA